MRACVFAPIIFYLLVERKSAQSHPINVQHNIQLAMRVRVISVLLCPDWRARYDGIKTMNANNKTATIYFTIVIIVF